MNTSLSWIKAYVPDLDVTAQEYTDAMTLSGTKVEGYEKLDADLDKIVIGQIDKIEKHPAGARSSSPGLRFAASASDRACVPQVICGRTSALSV